MKSDLEQKRGVHLHSQLSPHRGTAPESDGHELLANVVTRPKIEDVPLMEMGVVFERAETFGQFG